MDLKEQLALRGKKTNCKLYCQMKHTANRLYDFIEITLKSVLLYTEILTQVLFHRQGLKNDFSNFII